MLAHSERARKILLLCTSICSVGAARSYIKRARRKQLAVLLKARKIRDGNVARDRAAMLNEINGLPDYVFRSMFRVNRETFEEILTKIDSKMPVMDVAYAQRNVEGCRGMPLTNRVKLLATLRFLAGGMKWDICMAFKIGFGSFFATNLSGVVWPTCDAIDASYSIGLDPNNHDELKKMAEEFSHISLYSAEVFSKVVMAMDGWVMQTRKPYDSEVINVQSYMNRKGFWGMVVLAGCDARTRFTMWNCKNTGSCNDCNAWDVSAFRESLDLFPKWIQILGDEAFTCTNQVLVPWSGQGIGKAKDSFNYHLSVRRQVIERAFGILMKRWGVFSRPVVVAHKHWAKLATVCAKLHNVCIDANVPNVGRYEKDWKVEDRNELLVNDILHDNEPTPVTAHGKTTGAARLQMTNALLAMGVPRPPHSRNSKA